MTSKLQTGLDILDRKLDGGIPPGRIVALSGNSASQSDVFLYELARMRPTLYLTTIRSETALLGTFEDAGGDFEAVDVVHVDGSNPVEHASELLEDAPDGGNVIIDPILVLEQPGAEYWQFLDELKGTVVDREGLALLHCLEENGGTAPRAITEYVSDVVFQLSTKRQGDKIENQLAVPKFRGGAPLEEVIKLRMTTTVDIDISRNLV